MSRSYRHRCVLKEQNSWYGKKSASRTVRRSDHVYNEGNYRKHYCSYNICNFRINPTSFHTSLNEFRKEWTRAQRGYYRRHYLAGLSWKEAYRKWYKWYRGK